MSVKIALVSLGCPKNLVDAENMLGLLEQAGFTLTDRPETAHVIIVNTCGFIEEAVEESIQTILQMAKYKQSGVCRRLILAGCLGERYAGDLLAEMPEVDAIAGAHAWKDIVAVVQRVSGGERFVLQPAKAGFLPSQPRKLSTGGVTAYLKIAEGCDNACSYCMIPRLRGPYASKPFALVMEEARALERSGVKEIILVAQDITRYGQDTGGKLLLPELIRQIALLPGIRWIRLLYAYPGLITEELIEVLATENKVCKYLDIPLQHISDNVLARMNRPDKQADIINLLDRLRARIPGITLRTTFMVGFPGETPEEYGELKAFLSKQEFNWAGIFMYSQEEGTLAAEMLQVAPTVKEERYHELMSLQAAISERLNKRREGRAATVLVESIRKEKKQLLVSGRSEREAPEVDGLIYLENASGCRVGDFVEANIVQGFTYDVLAEVTGRQ